jgi:hypothetical protein
MFASFQQCCNPLKEKANRTETQALRPSPDKYR